MKEVQDWPVRTKGKEAGEQNGRKIQFIPDQIWRMVYSMENDKGSNMAMSS